MSKHTQESVDNETRTSSEAAKRDKNRLCAKKCREKKREIAKSSQSALQKIAQALGVKPDKDNFGSAKSIQETLPAILDKINELQARPSQKDQALQSRPTLLPVLPVPQQSRVKAPVTCHIPSDKLEKGPCYMEQLLAFTSSP
jgi:hypothetical protein